MATAGTQGVSVQFGGAATSGVETRVRIRRRLSEIGDARLTMIGAPADLTIPEDGDTVEITDVGASRVLFGGNVRTPSVEIVDGGELLEITVPCVGHEQRLQDTIISPADGIRIVQLDTAAEQIEEIVKLLEGEGFTTGALPDLGEGVATDMRFQPAYAVLRAIVEAASAVLIVSPEQEVTAPLLTALPSSGETLDGENTTDPRRSVDPKDRRTQQYLIGGVLDRTLAFVGDGNTRAFDLTGTEDPTDIELIPGAVRDVVVGQTGSPPVDTVRWSRVSGVAYGDLSGLVENQGDAGLLKGLDIGRATSGTVDQKNRSMLVSVDPTSTSIVRVDLSVAWEQSPRAVTLRAPGLEDLVVPGPDSSEAETNDLSELYSWRLTAAWASSCYNGQGLAQWKADVGALSQADQNAIVTVFSDGTTAAEGISLSVRSVARGDGGQRGGGPGTGRRRE